MLRVERLAKSFGAIRALHDVSFAVERGSITVFTGADGSGKSTLFKILVGLVQRDTGRIFWKDGEIGDDFSRLVGEAGYMPERFSLYTDLTVEENLDFFAAVYRVDRGRREEMKNRLLEKTGMSPFRDRRAGALSGGMKQKLALSTILLSSPELIILDEPTTGVDPLSRIEFFEIIRDLKAEGRTILLSTPYLDEAEKGDAVVMMKAGRILIRDSIAGIKSGFPARLFRIAPPGNVFSAMERLGAIPELRNDIYLRGRHIRYLQSGPDDRRSLIPFAEVVEETPSLEDIYIYYERQRA